MKGSTAVSKAQSAAQPTEKIYMENTLLRVAGALFCHDAKRARGSAERIELNRGLRDWNLVIDPHPNFGRPGPLAHKVFVAIIKKHSDYGRPVQGEVSFTRREIMRLVGRSQWGGRDSEQFAQALQQIHRTFVTAFFKDRSERFIEESFNVFPRILLARREKATDPIEECTIALADPIVASLRDDHFTCLNHTFMRELGTIGQALYMRLFFHFANHYDGHHDKRLKFEKRYDDICREWLGGLTVLKHRSKILGEQLGAHLDQLRAGEFLASYGIEPAQDAGRLRAHVPAGRALLRRLRPVLPPPPARGVAVALHRRAARHRRAAQGRLPLHREAHRRAFGRHPIRHLKRGGDRQAAPSGDPV